MKDFFKIVLIVLLLVTVFFSACRNNEEDRRVNFYLSQPRDAALFGWWERPYDSIRNIASFWKFKQAGTITDLAFQNDEVFLYYENRHYWYTEKRNEKNIMHAFFDDGFGIIESNDYYKIVGDSLWISNEISDTAKLYFFMKKTVAPEGYE
jgi:hypothetical protein